MIDINNLERITIVCGHYGCGKTNFSLNLALDIANNGKPVTLVDLDVVNPYFRSSDYKELLEQKSVHVITPCYAGTNLDTPSLSPEIDTVFDQEDRMIIFDVGGDDAGAYALGRYSEKIKNQKYSFIYLVNKYRNLTNTPQQAVEILFEINRACGLAADYIVNNSHLQGQTKPSTIINAINYGEEVANILNLPILCTTAPKSLEGSKELAGYDLYYVSQIVKPPFGC